MEDFTIEISPSVNCLIDLIEHLQQGWKVCVVCAIYGVGVLGKLWRPFPRFFSDSKRYIRVNGRLGTCRAPSSAASAAALQVNSSSNKMGVSVPVGLALAMIVVALGVSGAQVSEFYAFYQIATLVKKKNLNFIVNSCFVFGTCSYKFLKIAIIKNQKDSSSEFYSFYKIWLWVKEKNYKFTVNSRSIRNYLNIPKMLIMKSTIQPSVS